MIGSNIMKNIIITTLALFALVGCTTLGTIQNKSYDGVKTTLDAYCESSGFKAGVVAGWYGESIATHRTEQEAKDIDTVMAFCSLPVDERTSYGYGEVAGIIARSDLSTIRKIWQML